MIPYILAAIGGYLIGDSLKSEKYSKGGSVKRFVEMKGNKPVYALADAIYHVSFGTLNDKGFPVTTGTHKVYRTASGLKKIKEYKDNPEYSILEEKTDEKGIWHITFVANKSFLMDGKETKDVVSFDRDDLYANGGVMKKGGMVVTSIKDIPNFKQRLEEGRITYRGLGMGKLANDFYDLAGTWGWRIKVDGKEYYITEEEFDTFSRDANGKMRIRFDAPKRRFEKGGYMAGGGTVEERLEKIDIFNDLDEFEYFQYKRMIDSGIPKVDALKVLITNVEGDTTQLSKKLASIAKKIKYSDGGKTEPKLPHRYKIGDKIEFMNADYSTNIGKIVKQEVRYINMGGYNLYMVELDNGKIIPVAESDILDDYSKNRKFYNPD